jgi:hypothetical protein
MAFYHFKSSVLAAEIPTIELEFDAKLHAGQKPVSQTGTNKNSTETSMAQVSTILKSVIHLA